MEKRWLIPPRLPPEAERALHGYPPFLRQILYNRGYGDPEAARGYLEARTPPGTEPFLLSGVSQAVERIRFAIRRQEPIAIYGDYDVDGVTATALLVQILQRLGADVRGYIPNRFDEGYGLNNEALDNLYAQGIRLVITVDCGIRSLDEAEHAVRMGMDLIISDHHHPASDIPRALAVINPKLPGETYPEKDLAGVGLAYKLACALASPEDTSALEDTLDLVALGTVADLAPLVGENRSLVRAGLELLRRPRRQGTMALIGVSSLQPDKIDASHISFMLGPRLNAAGRLDTALAALNLLTTSDIVEAGHLAQQLDIYNRERQEITHQIQMAAEEMAQPEDPDTLLLFAARPEFNPGVVGLAASRLCEQYYRPTIIGARGDEYTRASCRSIPEFHITQALDKCAELLEHHGGHAAAAGFTVRNENLDTLLDRLRAIAADELATRDLRPILHADLELSLSELTPDFLTYLEWLQPTGYGNRPVHFVSRNLKVTRRGTVGKDGAHLKMSVTDGRITYSAIAFRQGQWLDYLPSYVDLLYAYELNEYNGHVSLQLNVRDIKPSR
jgi:single-stranded-DNA-specific exonuclease